MQTAAAIAHAAVMRRGGRRGPSMADAKSSEPTVIAKLAAVEHQQSLHPLGSFSPVVLTAIDAGHRPYVDEPTNGRSRWSRPRRWLAGWLASSRARGRRPVLAGSFVHCGFGQCATRPRTNFRFEISRERNEDM